jgi:GNAT superfamily N-acetyltransferase
MHNNSEMEIYPVTPERWADFEQLFGPRGAVGGCWCMWWRVTRAEFDRQKGEGNKLAMRMIIESGEIPGLLAYRDGLPVGWCSVQPRQAFPVLERSRVLKAVDDQPVWSVVCFFIARPYRRQGVTVKLLKGAIDYARELGAQIIEGYPVDPKSGETADVFAFTGTPSAFRKAGFVEVLRRSPTRPIMRYFIHSDVLQRGVAEQSDIHDEG